MATASKYKHKRICGLSLTWLRNDKILSCVFFASRYEEGIELKENKSFHNPEMNALVFVQCYEDIKLFYQTFFTV